MATTAQRLAEILGEEFERDAWGDVDPYLFRVLAEGHELDGEEMKRDVEGLKDVLERVADRLNKEG